MKECQHLGDYSNRFVYNHHDVTHIEAMKNGIPHYSNESQKNMDLKNMYSIHVSYWYQKMLQCFGKKCESISRECFRQEFFLFCLDFQSCPAHLFPSNEQKVLHLVTSGSIDLKIQFKENLKENLVLYAISSQSIIVKLNATGDLEDVSS